MRPPTPTVFPLLNELRAVLAEKPPFCSGTFELPPQAFELYYGKENARYVDFTKSASNVEALRQLADACEPAKFGKGTETVLDETYRKAWKMDPENFKTGLDVDACGLVDVVHTGLLPNHRLRNASAELYKLNVYGEGAFFKPHQDTPRGEDMFGSLVVVMPTAHEGGELVLRHNGQEWTFDAAKFLSGKKNNTLAYIAFFSDVEHEVLPVTAGYRVTLTYNLFYTWDTSTRLHRDGVSAVSPTHADVDNLRRLLGGLLEDPEFLPEGGTLGFGLRHGYPFPALWERGNPNPLERLKRWLKGSDHSLFQACEELGMKPLLRLLYGGDEYTLLLDEMVELYDEEGFADRILLDDGIGVAVKEKAFDALDKEAYLKWQQYNDWSDIDWTNSDGSPMKTVELYWVMDWGLSDSLRSIRLVYGNEASIEHIYAYVCLIVEVAPAADRVCSPGSAQHEAHMEDEKCARDSEEGRTKVQSAEADG